MKRIESSNGHLIDLRDVVKMYSSAACTSESATSALSPNSGPNANAMAKASFRVRRVIPPHR
jgi:hypothetical protein